MPLSSGERGLSQSGRAMNDLWKEGSATLCPNSRLTSDKLILSSIKKQIKQLNYNNDIGYKNSLIWLQKLHISCHNVITFCNRHFLHKNIDFVIFDTNCS